MVRFRPSGQHFDIPCEFRMFAAPGLTASRLLRSKLLGEIQEQGPEWVICCIGNNDLDSESFSVHNLLDKFSDLSEFFASLGAKFKIIELFHRSLPKYISEDEYQWRRSKVNIKLRKMLKGSPIFLGGRLAMINLYLSRDGVHLNSAGYRNLACHIMNAIGSEQYCQCRCLQQLCSSMLGKVARACKSKPPIEHDCRTKL